MRKSQLKNSEYHLTASEIQEIILAAQTERDRLIIKMLAHTGMRRFELAGLDVRDIDFDKRLLHIREGKGGKGRVVPMTKELASDLRIYLNKQPRNAGPVFVAERDPKKHGHLSPRQINNIVAEVGRRAGIANPNPKYQVINCHLFRHSFARLWKDQGQSIESLSKILGHTSVATTWDTYGTEDLQTISRNYDNTVSGIFQLNLGANTKPGQ